jgi:hypothetical protein
MRFQKNETHSINEIVRLKKVREGKYSQIKGLLKNPGNKNLARKATNYFPSTGTVTAGVMLINSPF